MKKDGINYKPEEKKVDQLNIRYQSKNLWFQIYFQLNTG